MKTLKWIFFCVIIGSTALVHAQEELRAPAYPLVTHSPYQSIWSMGDELNTSATKHWTEQAHSLVGIVKVDDELYRFLGESPKVYQTVVPASDEIEYTVSYSEKKPSSNWIAASFDDSAWKKGEAPFSDNREEAGTIWESDDLWFRRTFDLADVNLKTLYLKLHHDDNVKVFLNGEEIYNMEGWKAGYKYIPIETSVINNLKNKNNVLAIHIENTAGGRWLDTGLVTDAPSMEDVVVHKAEQIDVTLNATQTIYTFNAGKIEVQATFTSPLLLDNLEILSRPISYLSVKVKSRGEEDHDVKVYLGVSSSLAVNSPEAWNYSKNDLNILKVGTTEQPVLQRKGDDIRIDWVHAYVAAPSAGTMQYITSVSKAFLPLVGKEKKPVQDEMNGKNLMLNTIADLGRVGNQQKEQVFMLGYDELYTVQYFDSKLKPWWEKDGSTIEEEFAAASENYKRIIKECQAFDSKLYKEAKLAGGERYADLCVLPIH